MRPTTTISGSSSTSTSTTTSTAVAHKIPAPVRCFLNDVPHVIQQQYESYKNNDQKFRYHQQNHQQWDDCYDDPNVPRINQHNFAYYNSNGIKRRKIEQRYDVVPRTLYLRLLGTVIHVSRTMECMNDSNGTSQQYQQQDENVEMNIGHPYPIDKGQHQQERQVQTMYDYCIVLDDGTSVNTETTPDCSMIYVTSNMIHQLSIQNGMILDIIVRVELQQIPLSSSSSSIAVLSKSQGINNSYASTTRSNTKSNCTVRLIADQITVQDTTNEMLRWLEISYKKQQCIALSKDHHVTNDTTSGADVVVPNTTTIETFHDVDTNQLHPNKMTLSSSPPPQQQLQLPSQSPFDITWLGYPTRTVSSEDIYRIIAYECEFYKDDDENMNSLSSSTISQQTTFPTNTDTSCRRGKGGGVSLNDIAACYDEYHISYITSLVQELQNSGQIYLNENGLYTLL